MPTYEKRMPNETAGWSDKSASRVPVTYGFYLFVILSSYRGRSRSNTRRLRRAIDSSRFAQKKSRRLRIKANSAVNYRHYADQRRSGTIFSLIYFYYLRNRHTYLRPHRPAGPPRQETASQFENIYQTSAADTHGESPPWYGYVLFGGILYYDIMI